MGQYHTLYAFNPVAEKMEVVSPHALEMPAKLPEILYACMRTSEGDVDFFFQLLLLGALRGDVVRGKVLGRWYNWRLCIMGDNAELQDREGTFLEGVVKKVHGIDKEEAATWATELGGVVPDGLAIVCHDKREFVRLFGGNIRDESGAFLSMSALIFLLAASGDWRSKSDAFPYIIVDDDSFIPQDVAKEIAETTKPEAGIDFVDALIYHPWYRGLRIVGRWGGCVISIERAEHYINAGWNDITVPALTVAANELMMDIEYPASRDKLPPRVEEIRKGKLILSSVPPVLCFREDFVDSPSVPTAVCRNTQCVVTSREGELAIIVFAT